MIESSLLSWIVFMPVLGALLVLALPGVELLRRVALGAAGLTFVLSLGLTAPFLFGDASSAAYGNAFLQHRFTWIDAGAGAFRVEYFLGVDGLSMPLIILTTLVMLLAVAASWNFEQWKTRGGLRSYLALLLLLETGLLGVFAALDFFLFYVFWEVMLLPMYFLIGVWGGPRREYAAIKFFLYTLAGSVLLLVAMLALYFVAPAELRTFDILRLATDADLRQLYNDPGTLLLGMPFAQVVFVLMALAFAVKVPIVPLHTWLPDAHVEAPTPVSMVLAGVLLKMGGYGLLRFCYPILPAAGEAFAVALGCLGVFSILYGALCAMAQDDFKRLVAYSSISHMGFVVLGLSAMNPIGFQGALFQMLAHGVSSPMCFFLVGMLYDRLGHRDLNRMGGAWLAMPRYGALATIGFFATLGLPTLCGFIGEVLTIYAAFTSERLSAAGANVLLGALAASGAVLTAAYVLWMMQRVYLGPPHAELQRAADGDRRELAILAPLAALAILLGVLPQQTVLTYVRGALNGILDLPMTVAAATEIALQTGAAP